MPKLYHVSVLNAICVNAPFNPRYRTLILTWRYIHYTLHVNELWPMTFDLTDLLAKESFKSKRTDTESLVTRAAILARRVTHGNWKEKWVLQLRFIRFFWWPTNQRAGYNNMQSALIVSNGTLHALYTCVCCMCINYFCRNMLDLFIRLITIVWKVSRGRILFVMRNCCVWIRSIHEYYVLFREEWD